MFRVSRIYFFLFRISGFQNSVFRSRAFVSCFGILPSGFGFRVSGFRVRGSGYGFLVSGFGFRASAFCFPLSGFRFQFSGFGFRASTFGFRGSGGPAPERRGAAANVSEPTSILPGLQQVVSNPSVQVAGHGGRIFGIRDSGLGSRVGGATSASFLSATVHQFIVSVGPRFCEHQFCE